MTLFILYFFGLCQLLKSFVFFNCVYVYIYYSTYILELVPTSEKSKLYGKLVIRGANWVGARLWGLKPHQICRHQSTFPNVSVFFFSSFPPTLHFTFSSFLLFFFPIFFFLLFFLSLFSSFLFFFVFPFPLFPFPPFPLFFFSPFLLFFFTLSSFLFSSFLLFPFY